MLQNKIIKEILIIFFIALSIRAVYFLFFIDTTSLTHEDQSLYIQLGQIIAKTGEFVQLTNGSYSQMTERVPGYPVFLAVIFKLISESNTAVVLIQIFIDSLTCVIIGLITNSVLKKGFLVGGMVSALNINMIILSGMILTDTLFLFLFSIFLFFSIRFINFSSKLNMLLAIFFLCIATLVRPVSYYLILLLPLLILFFAWKRGASIKQIVFNSSLYTLLIVTTFGYIQHRNYTEYNSLSLVSQGGSHALYWIVPAVYQYSGQGSYQEGQIWAKSYLDKTMYRDGFVVSSRNPFENSGYKMKAAQEALVELGLLNVLHSWSAVMIINFLTPSVAYAPVVRAMEHPSFYATPGNGAIEKLTNYVTSTNGLFYLLIITIGTASSLIFLIISIFGLYRMIKLEWIERENNKEILLFLLFTVIYFIAITGPIVGVKYRLPIEPIMTIFFSYVLVGFRRNKQTK